MYQYLEIIAEMPSISFEGLGYLSMQVDDNDRKWPVGGVIKEFEALPDGRTLIMLP